MNFVKVKIIGSQADIDAVIEADKGHWLAEEKGNYSLDEVLNLAVMLYGEHLTPIIMDKHEIFTADAIFSVDYVRIAQNINGRLFGDIQVAAFIPIDDPSVAWIEVTDEVSEAMHDGFC